MKKAKIVLAILVGLVISQISNAQRVMNDPTYSINNYKHPNKSAYMKKQQDAQPVVYVEEVKDENAIQAEENSMTSSGNYKGMSASKSKTKKFRASDSPSAKPFFHVTPSQNSNYKQQFQARPRKEKESKEEQGQDIPVANN